MTAAQGGLGEACGAGGPWAAMPGLQLWTDPVFCCSGILVWDENFVSRNLSDEFR